MEEIKIKLNCPPASFSRQFMTPFMKGAFHDLVVFAYKIGNRIVVTKNNLLKAIESKGYGFKDVAQHYNCPTWEIAEVKRSDCSFL